VDLAIDKQRTGRWRTVIDVISMAIIALALVADVADLVGYLRKPAAYPVGAEAAGLRYSSRACFIGATLAAIALYIIGLVGPTFTRNRRRRTATRIAVALWAVASTAWFILSVG
jgi:hypothetical protein